MPLVPLRLTYVHRSACLRSGMPNDTHANIHTWDNPPTPLTSAAHVTYAPEARYKEALALTTTRVCMKRLRHKSPKGIVTDYYIFLIPPSISTLKVPLANQQAKGKRVHVHTRHVHPGTGTRKEKTK